MPKILIADDNHQITSILAEYAKREGYRPIIAYDGSEALEKFHQEQPDIILLDIMMPIINGFEVCKTIRQTSNVPIIMVTARSEDFEKIMGLDCGADDYVIKPFSTSEVMARIRAVMRRAVIYQQDSASQSDQDVFSIDNLTISLETYTVTINQTPINLTKKETELLYTLAINKNKVFSRENLLNSIWSYDYFGDCRTVDSHIKRLRSKLSSQTHENWDIKTIWGVGYKFEVNGNA